MTSSPIDPLQTLQSALTVQANSKEQANLLAVLRETLERQPAPIPILVNFLIGIVTSVGDSLLKRWVIDLLHFAICRSALSLDQRTQMSSQALDALSQLIDDRSPAIVKLTIQCLTTVYPLLFRHLCTSRNNYATWNILSTCKNRIIELLWSSSAGVGVRLSAVKFVHQVILVQTRGIPDPRLQNKNDPNLSLCPADHPFIPAGNLESEGQKLLEGILVMLYSTENADLLCAMINSWPNLIKLRATLLPTVLVALKQWTPAAMTGLPSSIRSVEKTIRVLLIHISRVPNCAHYTSQVNSILSQQHDRMEKAALDEKHRKAAALLSASDIRKRALSLPIESIDTKRPKIEYDFVVNSPASFLTAFDFTSLPASLITELIVANLAAFEEATLIELVQTFRESRGLCSSSMATVSLPTNAVPLSVDCENTHPQRDESSTTMPILSAKIADEPPDPLQMDIDTDELEYEPDKLNEELSGNAILATLPMTDSADVVDIQLIQLQLPPPKFLSPEDQMKQVALLVNQIRKDAGDLKVISNSHTLSVPGQLGTEVWMLLMVRMVTRVAYPQWSEEDNVNGRISDKTSSTQDLFYRQDQQRQKLCDYIMSDFPTRLSLATLWMNEEWYNDQIRHSRDLSWRPSYETWLNQIVSSYQTLLDGKDRTFGRFILDLPHVPAEVLDLLREFCLDANSPERMQVGYQTLRGLVIQRPSMRVEAVAVLLELTTHPEKKTRAAAINSVKMWVPNTPPMDAMVRDFALRMLKKLQSRPMKSNSRDVIDGMNSLGDGSENNRITLGQNENLNEAQFSAGISPRTPYLPEFVKLPSSKSLVLQHVELLFALSVKVPEFLDEIFSAYCHMDFSVQESIQDLITALIRSLGSNHGKLLTLLRTCPTGAESLALRVLTIFTENGRPSPQLVSLIKGLIGERNLDARFLIPIIAEMDKPDILRHLPRIVSILNGQSDPKSLVRSVFSSVVTTPPQSFGSVTSNLPRVRSSELLTPAELMVLLHDSEKEIGLKSAIEAISICFSMTDVFRSEILAVVMQQIMDEPVLPVLFLRTVIQAVTTYKSLVGFVSTTLLSRLITKKIWTNPPLWEGFIRCAKVIAPASFGALLQLPKDQLRELVDKQPSLKAGLRDYVTKKATNKARVAGFLDIFGDVEDSTSIPNTSADEVSVPEFS